MLKPRLLFSHAGYAFWGFAFSQFNWIFKTDVLSSTHKYSFSKCLLRHDVVRVFVSLCVLVFVRAFCHGALKLDISTLFTTFFIWTFIFNLYWVKTCVFWHTYVVCILLNCLYIFRSQVTCSIARSKPQIIRTKTLTWSCHRHAILEMLSVRLHICYYR